jgi:hypothetical protein
LISQKVAVNHFHLPHTFHHKKSVQFMSNSLQIFTRGWHLTNVN